MTPEQLRILGEKEFFQMIRENLIVNTRDKFVLILKNDKREVAGRYVIERIAGTVNSWDGSAEDNMGPGGSQRTVLKVHAVPSLQILLTRFMPLKKAVFLALSAGARVHILHGQDIHKWPAPPKTKA